VSVVAYGICLALAGMPAHDTVFVPEHAFTLAWTHSIERVRWEERYEVRPPPTGEVTPVLVLVAARIRGSGAGMEPPPDAVLRDGWYEYTPTMPPRHDLLLTRSRYVPDFDFCSAQGCRSLGTLLPSDGGVTRLSACKAESTS
jgi:hypothetical protein